MTRKFLVPLRAEINNLLADNTTGLISPADVRTMVMDTLDSASNSDAFYASNTPSAAVALTAVGIIPPAPSPTSNAEAPTYVSINPATRIFTVSAPAVGFSLVVQCQLTVSVANNVVLSLELFVNNVLSLFNAQVVGTGVGNPATMTFSGYIPHCAAGVVDMRLRSLSGNTNATINGLAMAVILVPTENAT